MSTKKENIVYLDKYKKSKEKDDAKDCEKSHPKKSKKTNFLGIFKATRD